MLKGYWERQQFNTYFTVHLRITEMKMSQFWPNFHYWRLWIKCHETEDIFVSLIVRSTQVNFLRDYQHIREKLVTWKQDVNTSKYIALNNSFQVIHVGPWRITLKRSIVTFHWRGRNQMADDIFIQPFLCMKTVAMWFKSQWDFFRRVQLV